MACCGGLGLTFGFALFIGGGSRFRDLGLGLGFRV